MHPGVFMNGCEGTYEVPSDSGHEKTANIAVVLTATYTDDGTADADPLTGADTVRLSPKQIQAEHFTAMSGIQLNDRPAAEGGRRVGFTNAGDWINFEPVSLKGIDSVKVRYTSGGAGGIVQFRLDAPDGPVVGTAELPNSGGWDTYAEVSAPLTPTDEEAHTLYLVFTNLPGGATADLFDLDELTFGGRGITENAAPSATANADRTTGPVPLAVAFTGEGEDPEGTAVTYAWDFDGDGTTDATTKDATHTYTTVGKRTATFTVTDATGRSRSSSIDIDAYAPVVGCAGDDEFEGNSLEHDPLEHGGAPQRRVPLRGRRRAAHRRAAAGHPRRRDRPAEHRPAGPARLGPVDRDDARHLEPDGQLPERRADGLPVRREPDQDGHGLERRPQVRGVQGAQQLRRAASARRPTCPPRSRTRSTCAWSPRTARRCSPSTRPTA